MSVDIARVQKLVNYVNSCLDMEPELVLTDEILDNILQRAVYTFPKMGFTSEETEAAKRDLTYRRQIFCTPGQSILDDYDSRKWYTEKKEAGEITEKFWERYKTYLINEKNFPPSVVTTLGKETLERDIMNYLGDPDSTAHFLKRGLVIGDVQSGKTSTYIGLMCKAADAGYKVFILLTGTIESLRRQTQERVEEGFIGFNMSAERDDEKRVGVGLDNKPIFAMAMTSRKSDFTGDSNQIAVSLRSNDAVVFVIKKNTNVLQKLIEWLRTINADRLTGKIDEPMLLIDDEADNASINTSKSKEDPTRINKLIREMAALFTKSNYVGFTATPYANVFIDPVTTEEMLNHDLFPEDFIYALPTPSDYIGPQQTFDHNGKYYSQLIPIHDAGNTEEDGWPFYFKHKKDWEDTLPESLTDAIYTFYLANAIRDLRGQQTKHRSMLVNVSRFVRVQYYIKSEIETIHKNAYNAIKFNLDPHNTIESLKDPVLKRIYANWCKQYEDTGIEWEDVAKVLYHAIEEIQIKVVNSTTKKDKLVYEDNNPIRVIAIGGLALSRGLTLEGLMISYFYRNTATYDVLMQMGRWFGYRRGYDDIFRIWTHPDSARWYAEIAEATEILKNDMRTMHDNEMKPREFGIRVRNDCKELQITAPNKRRNTRDVFEFSGYAGRLCETPYLCSDAVSNRENFIRIRSFTEENVDAGKVFEQMRGSGLHYVLQDIEKAKIIQLIRQLKFSKYNSNFDKTQILDYLSTEADPYIDLWDVAFLDGSVKTKAKEIVIRERTIYKIDRSNCTVEKDRLRIGKRGKMGGTGDGKIGIIPFNGKAVSTIIDEAKEKFKKSYRSEKGAAFADGREYPADTWFKYIKDRKPIVLVYFIDVDSDNNSEAMRKYKAQMTDADGFEVPSVGLAVGFPSNDNAIKSSKRKYTANAIYNYFEQEEAELEMEEEE